MIPNPPTLQDVIHLATITDLRVSAPSSRRQLMWLLIPGSADARPLPITQIAVGENKGVRTLCCQSLGSGRMLQNKES
jgi:hypothetical protein